MSWSYRDCWRQTCSQVDPLRIFHLLNIPPAPEQITGHRDMFRRCLTAMMAQYGAIYVPAADRGHGSRVSGFLSGIKP